MKVCPYCRKRLQYVHDDDKFRRGYYECFDCGYTSEYDYEYEYVDDYDYKKGLEEYYESEAHR